jgi:hypothetical protein
LQGEGKEELPQLLISFLCAIALQRQEFPSLSLERWQPEERSARTNRYPFFLERSL